MVRLVLFCAINTVDTRWPRTGTHNVRRPGNRVPRASSIRSSCVSNIHYIALDFYDADHIQKDYLNLQPTLDFRTSDGFFAGVVDPYKDFTYLEDDFLAQRKYFR